jgi:hypothetical protein
VYEKYRYSCYYWECVILLEAFTLTLLLVLLMTQNNAALQVLVAMAVIFVEAVLHVSHARVTLGIGGCGLLQQPATLPVKCGCMLRQGWC